MTFEENLFSEKDEPFQMRFFPESDHGNGRHEQHASCRQVAVSSDEEEEDLLQGRLAPDALQLLDELHGLRKNQPDKLASLFWFFCFRGILSHEKPLSLIQRAVS